MLLVLHAVNGAIYHRVRSLNESDTLSQISRSMASSLPTHPAMGQYGRMGLELCGKSARVHMLEGMGFPLFCNGKVQEGVVSRR